MFISPSSRHVQSWLQWTNMGSNVRGSLEYCSTTPQNQTDCVEWMSVHRQSVQRARILQSSNAEGIWTHLSTQQTHKCTCNTSAHLYSVKKKSARWLDHGMKLHYSKFSRMDRHARSLLCFCFHSSAWRSRFNLKVTQTPTLGCQFIRATYLATDPTFMKVMFTFCFHFFGEVHIHWLYISMPRYL